MEVCCRRTGNQRIIDTWYNDKGEQVAFASPLLFFDIKIPGSIMGHMKYLAVIKKSKYGYDVHVPSLPGCHSQGDTEEEALENIRDAIVTYLQMEQEELQGAKVREVEIAFA